MRNLLTVVCLWVCIAIVHADNTLKISHLSENDTFLPCDITCAVEDADGFVWLGSRSGLIRYDGVRFVYYPVHIADKDEFWVNSIDRIWLQDDGKLLCRCANRFALFDTKAHSFIATDMENHKELPSYKPDSAMTAMVGSLPDYRGCDFFVLLKDRQGGIWVRTETGLDRIVSIQKPISPLPVSSDGKEVTRLLYADRQGRVWVADKNGVVRIIDGEGQTKGFLTSDGRISAAYAVFGTAVYAMLQDHHGDFWMGTKPNGLYRLKRQGDTDFEVEHWLLPESTEGNNTAQMVYALAEDNSNRLWIGTYGDGLRMIDISRRDDISIRADKNIISLLPKQAFTVRRLTILPSQVMLIGTNVGLYTCKLQQQTDKMRLFRTLPIDGDGNGLLSSRVMDIATDQHGRVFLATYGGGVSQIATDNLLADNLRMKNYTMQDGLPTNICIGLQASADGRLCVITQAGISLISPDLDTSPALPRAHTLRCENFSIRAFSGVHHMEEAHPLLLPSGKIIAGTNNGPLMFSLDEVRKSSFSPKIVFDSPSRIDLSPDERSLVLTFSSIDLNSNGAALYAYKMDGIDEDWTYTRENRIQYSRLPAGDFVLRVRSANSDGVWTDNEQQLTIHRTPHFNERPAAWMFYGVLASLLAFIAFRLYRYIKSLQSALSSIQLSNSEKVEYLEARLYDALHEQKKQKAEPAESASEDITEENRLFKEKIEAFIKSRLGDPDLSVQDIAQEMAMSRSLLYLQTKNIMGCTPNNLIVEYRMEHAVRLMNDMGTNISDIAYSCGFSDPKYFARCFKKATGMTPSEYRKMKS